MTAPGPLADIGPTGLVAAVPAEPVAAPGPVPAETSGMTDVINAWLQEFETNSDAKDQNKALADLLANDLASRAEAAARFLALQSRVIAEIDLAAVSWHTAQEQGERQRALRELARQRVEALRAQMQARRPAHAQTRW